MIGVMKRNHFVCRYLEISFKNDLLTELNLDKWIQINGNFFFFSFFEILDQLFEIDIVF
jgi:hypothetical protein